MIQFNLHLHYYNCYYLYPYNTPLSPIIIIHVVCINIIIYFVQLAEF